MLRHKPKLALIVDPRFSGGTSSAVAHELRALAPYVRLSIYAVETRMFKGQTVNPKIQDVIDELGLEVTWNPKVIRSEFVAFHNPSCLKFNKALDLKIICDTAYIVTHENLLRPNGGEGFDVGLCLRLIEKSLLCRNKYLVAVSGYNAAQNARWLDTSGAHGWKLADFHWFNICDFETVAPTATPRDRRGRMSRAGFEKFPALPVMERHFPPHAESCAILGGDSLLIDPEIIPEHWEVLPFGAMPVDAFFSKLDFFVYFTHPQLRESFGRVIAEAIAAGKVVITDPGTAQTFGSAVIASKGDDVDEIIARFVEQPELYQDFVLEAQKILQQFEADAFVKQVLSQFAKAKEIEHAVV